MKKQIVIRHKAIVISIAIIVIIFGFLVFLASNRDSESTGDDVGRNTETQACTTYGGRVEEQCAEDYNGMSVSNAVAKAGSFGLIPKVYPGVNLDIGGLIISFEVENDFVAKTTFTEVVELSKNSLSNNYADVSDRSIQTYDECVEAGGILSTRRKPRLCFYESVIYTESYGERYLRDTEPIWLRSYEECDQIGGSKYSEDRLSCTLFEGITYYYDGSSVNSYEDCTNLFNYTAVNCTTPDGTSYDGPFAR